MSKRAYTIDINCDLGEGMGNEEQLLPLISSCSLACGGHAGSPELLREILLLASKLNVKAGAHPSYPDRKNFGRISLDLSAEELKTTLEEQLATFLRATEFTGTTLHHIKAHGALYNDLARDTELARIYLEIMAPYRESTILFAPCESVFARLAGEAGFEVWEEAFGDRAYNADGSLVGRKNEGAVLSDPKKVLKQIVQMVCERKVHTGQDSYFSLNPTTICLHGDTPGALEILTYLSRELPLARITIAR